MLKMKIQSIFNKAIGQGKSFLTAIFCCTRAILFPESKIILSAGNIKQSIEVLEKIEDLRNNSPNLAREIEELKTNPQTAGIKFRNGSWIKVVASNQGGRSKIFAILIRNYKVIKLGKIGES